MKDFKKEFAWLGEVHGTQDVMGYTIVKVLHNKISNRKRDEYGFHVVYPNGKVHTEYYPNSTYCLMAISLLESGKSTDAVVYMARVANIDHTVIRKEETILDHEGFVPTDICGGDSYAGRRVEVVMKVRD